LHAGSGSGESAFMSSFSQRRACLVSTSCLAPLPPPPFPSPAHPRDVSSLGYPRCVLAWPNALSTASCLPLARSSSSRLRACLPHSSPLGPPCVGVYIYMATYRLLRLDILQWLYHLSFSLLPPSFILSATSVTFFTTSVILFTTSVTLSTTLHLSFSSICHSHHHGIHLLPITARHADHGARLLSMWHCLRELLSRLSLAL
jgi:hypothetical protein